MQMLFLCDHYFPYIGGAEIVNRAIAEHFADTYDVTVVSKSFRGLNDKRTQINRVNIYRTANVPRMFHSITAYLGASRFAQSADIIISATYASGLAGYWLARRYNKKALLLVHEILGENWKYFKNNHFLYSWYEKYIVTRSFDRYIAVSNYTGKKLIEYGIPDNRVSVIYNGIDERRFYPRPIARELRNRLVGDTEFVYLFYGRPRGYKGLDYLLRAVSGIADAIPSSKLILLLGLEPQPEYKKAMQCIEQLSLRDKIVLLKPVPPEQLPDYINIADTVVVPSLSEGFGYTAAESCMLGKPVVVTNAGSLPEVVFGRVVMIQKADVQAIINGVLQSYRGEWTIVPHKYFRWKDSLKQYEEVIQSLVYLKS
jgi:D-inositol-3-phosphate glycosyltransferase